VSVIAKALLKIVRSEHYLKIKLGFVELFPFISVDLHRPTASASDAVQARPATSFKHSRE
jgi:hypothetical protein